MKNLLLILLIVFVLPIFGQDSASVEPKASKLSFGAMIITSGYSSAKNSKSAGGSGLVFNLKYDFNDRISFGPFLRLSSIVNGIPGLNGCGMESSICDETIEKFFSAGLNIEFKIKQSFGVHLVGGVETVDVPRELGYVYGGGLSIYMPSSKSKRLKQSFHFTAYNSINQSTTEWLPYSGEGSRQQGRVFYDSIIFQMGWRLQFYGMKSKK